MIEYKMNMDAAKNNAEASAKDEAEKKASSGGGNDDIFFYNFDIGVHTMRFLPPWSEALALSGGLDMAVYYHRNLPKGDNRPWKICCPVETFPSENINCEVCRVLSNIKANSTHDMYAMRPQVRFFTNVLPRTAEVESDMTDLTFVRENNIWVNKNNVVPIVSYPITVHRWLVKTLVSPMVGNFIAAQDGVDISVTRTGVGLETEYFMGNAAFRSPIHSDKDVMQTVMDNMHDLNKIFRIPDDAYLESISKVAQSISDMYPIATASNTVLGGSTLADNKLSTIPSVVNSPQAVSETLPVATPAKEVKEQVCTDGEKLFGKYRKEVACTSCLHELACIDASPADMRPFAGSM